MVKKVLKYRRIYILGLIPISLLIVYLAKQSSFFTEHIFALGIYKILSQIISSITGILPFSLAEILIIVLPAVIFTIVIRFIIKVIKNKGQRKSVLIKGILNLLCTGSILFFSYTILCGVNYYRYPFSYYADLEVRESTVEELYALCEKLVLQANELREEVLLTDDEGVFKFNSNSIYKVANVADKAYQLLSEKYSVLGGFYSSPKPILLSSAMSYTDTTGIFFPFTMEANVNVDIVDYLVPSVMCHELAHLRGFMREDEANYISYLACMESDSIEFQYSGTMLALSNAGNALYAQDTDLYFQMRENYSKHVERDVRANAVYWVKHENDTISTVSNKINDTYLKANSQADGVKSYGRMVDLLLAQFREENIKE